MVGNFLKNLRGFRYLTAMLVTLSIQGALGATTTLTFDDLPTGVAVSNQYQSLGVIADGAITIAASFTPWPAQSGINVAYAPTGLANFALDPLIIGNIQSMAVYVSSDADVGVYAYDSLGNLVGSAVTTGPNSNTLLSITSSGNPIVSVAIHDGGSSFAIDTLSFTSAPPVLTCVDVISQLATAVAALPSADFRKLSQASAQRTQMAKDVAYLQLLVTTNAPDYRIYLQLVKIGAEVELWVKPTANRATILQLLKQIYDKTNAHQC